MTTRRKALEEDCHESRSAQAGTSLTEETVINRDLARVMARPGD